MVNIIGDGFRGWTMKITGKCEHCLKYKQAELQPHYLHGTRLLVCKRCFKSMCEVAQMWNDISYRSFGGI